MVKVTYAQDRVVRIEGRLEGGILPELSVLGGAGWTIELSGVVSIDDRAREFLHRKRAEGCRLVGASMYIAQLLEERHP